MGYLKNKKGSLESSILSVWTEAAKKTEGNAFGMALQQAKEKGEKTFTVAGKTYDVKKEQEKNREKLRLQQQRLINEDKMKRNDIHHQFIHPNNKKTIDKKHSECGRVFKKDGDEVNTVSKLFIFVFTPVKTESTKADMHIR